MKKKILFICTFILGLFLITGCTIGEDEIEQQEKEDAKLETKFEVKQISDKELSFTVQNGKKGTTKKGTIVIEEGEDVVYTYSFHGMKEGMAYLIPKGKTKDDYLVYDSIVGEGESTTYDIEAGEYEVIFEVEKDILTGSMSVKVTNVEEDDE